MSVTAEDMATDARNMRGMANRFDATIPGSWEAMIRATAPVFAALDEDDLAAAEEALARAVTIYGAMERAVMTY